MGDRTVRLKMTKKGKFVILGIVGAIILALVIFIVTRGSSKKEDISVTVETVSTEIETVTEAETKDPHINQARSMISGLWVDAGTVNNSPLAIMFGNTSEACPQSSLSYADIVFESPVEGNITRLCGVFENGTSLFKIGPVRSCRTYYALFAKEYEASYIHFGYSEYAEEVLQMKSMHTLDGMVYCNFYRSTDREAPHNAYTSWAGIMESVGYKGYPTVYPEGYEQPLKFNTDDAGDVTIAGGQTCMSFYPGYSYNRPWFNYNPAEKQYYRFQFGQAQTDAETGNQLRYKNILVKYVGGGYYPNGTPDFTVTGTGKGIFITDGNATEVTWVNNSKYGATRYYYADGAEIVLNQGKTWICQVPAASQGSVRILDSIQ